MKKYPDEIKAFILENYLGIATSELVQKVNDTFGTSYTNQQMRSYKQNHKLNSGYCAQFPKGHVPWTKGMKGVHFSPGTEFKKGNQPSNHREIGSRRVTVDGYHEEKIADPNKWKQVHRLMWENAYGPIPKGENIIFLNGNKDDLRLENLEMVTHRENLQLMRKGLRFDNEELTKVGVAVAKLEIACAKKKRGE